MFWNMYVTATPQKLAVYMQYILQTLLTIHWRCFHQLDCMKAAGYPNSLTTGSHRLGTGGCTRQYACPHAWDIGVLCLLIAYMMGSVLGRKCLVLNLLDIRGAKHFCLLSLLIICCNLFHTLVYFMIATCFILDFSCYFYIFIVAFWLIN